MKKIIVVILLIASTISMYGCSSTNTPIDDISEMEIYDMIYDGKAKEKYDVIQGSSRYMASYGYMHNDTQGYNHWYYHALADDMKQPLNFIDNEWVFDDAKMMDGLLYPTEDISLIRTFISPIAQDQVTISGTIKIAEIKENSSDIQFQIQVNGEKVYPTDQQEMTIAANDHIGIYFSFVIALNLNDIVDFIVSGDNIVFLNPSIDYTNQSLDTLYYVPSWGYYGDLHEFYANDTVNLFHLRNLPNNHWEWYLLQSQDMFRYKESSVYTTDFVTNHYMAYASTNDLNDYDTYPAGSRDMTMFYDEDIDRFRYIGLTYKTRDGNVNSDLSMRTSSDAAGLVWNEPAIALRSFPLTIDGEPECAAFRKIGNRWYLYAGISGQSIHGVGGLSYWVGGENQTIDQVDWKNLPTYHLDGEDLCVPQIESVRDKWYLFGWMPQKYNGNLWGGYKNLPREVYVRENGLLGTRLDPVATALLNKGTIAIFSENNTQLIAGHAEYDRTTISLLDNDINRLKVNGIYDSTFVTYQLDMMQASEAGFLMRSNNQTYKIIIKNDGGQYYLRVESPDDASHNLNSYVKIDDLNTALFDVKIIIEGGIIEFYVNDVIALSARTSMGLNYTAEIYSKGQVTFENVRINRLSQLYDIYE